MIEPGTQVRTTVRFNGMPAGTLAVVRHSYDERGLYYDVEFDMGDWRTLYTMHGRELEVVADAGA